MKEFVFLTLAIFLSLNQISARNAGIDKRWVCNIKTNCLNCLQLPQCTWCEEQRKCFSTNLPGFQDFCKENATLNVDYGMSFENNAKCACLGKELKQNCRPGTKEGPECSNRGKCECGRCVCDPTPDPEHPSKVIIGEYCELDNFSCDGPRCNEGPYHYINSQLANDAVNEERK